MSHKKAVWTDENERVKRKHYHPDEVDTSDVDSITEEFDSRPTVEPWQSVTEKFNETDGFYYEVEDPLDGVSLTTEQELLLNYAKDNDEQKMNQYIDELTSGGN